MNSLPAPRHHRWPPYSLCVYIYLWNAIRYQQQRVFVYRDATLCGCTTGWLCISNNLILLSFCCYIPFHLGRGHSSFPSLSLCLSWWLFPRSWWHHLEPRAAAPNTRAWLFLYYYFVFFLFFFKKRFSFIISTILGRFPRLCVLSIMW